jgi:cell division protein FtsL
MTAMRTAPLAAPAVVAVLAVAVGVALQHHTPRQLPGTIASSHIALADATDDNNDWVQQQQEQDQLQEELASQEMVQSEQAAEQQNEMAQQEAQQAEQQGMMVEPQANQ